MSVIQIPVTSKSGHNRLASVSEWDRATRPLPDDVSDGRQHSAILTVYTKFLLKNSPPAGLEHSTAVVLCNVNQGNYGAFTYAADSVVGYFQWDDDKEKYRWILDIADDLLIDTQEGGGVGIRFQSWILYTDQQS